MVFFGSGGAACFAIFLPVPFLLFLEGESCAGDATDLGLFLEPGGRPGPLFTGVRVSGTGGSDDTTTLGDPSLR